MTFRRNYGDVPKDYRTEDARIRRICNHRGRQIDLSDELIRDTGQSRPANESSAQRLARLSIVHKARRNEEQLSAAMDYENQEMVALVAPIPLRTEKDGTILYA